MTVNNKIGRSPPILDSLGPEILQAAREVDKSLLAWTASLSIRQRLDNCTQASRALGRFQHVITPKAG